MNAPCGFVASTSKKLALRSKFLKSMFKGHCFPEAVILQAVYFKLRFSLSYRDIEELLKIRGVIVDHATIQRWVVKFKPMFDMNFRKRKKIVGMRWRLDETKQNDLNQQPYRQPIKKPFVNYLAN